MNDLSRRDLLQVLGAGLLISVTPDWVVAQVPPDQRARRQAPGAQRLSARLHIGADGVITVMSGKVEGGQGARAQITQAAAEELAVRPEQVRVILGDTELCPDDGPTVGSRTTPSTIPNVRRAAAAARGVLIGLAAKRWGVDPVGLSVADGVVRGDGKTLAYGDLVGDDLKAALDAPLPDGVQVSDVQAWKVLGHSLNNPNGRDIVTGKHQYPSDIRLEGMHCGMVLRPPSYGATLEDLDESVVARDVKVVRDGDFVGVVAPTSYACREAIAALEKSARWKTVPGVKSDQLYEHLRKTARNPGGLNNPYDAEMESAAKALKQEYHVAYVQHAPLEPRAAVAEWKDGKLTVYTGTQIPTRVKSQLTDAFKLSAEQVRVIVPDFGGGFGGKHTGEAAVEAARLAKGAGRPVSLRWTREEEFTWAYFRPAALILSEASLSPEGAITSWFFINVNSGPAGIRTPYRCPVKQEQFIDTSAPPLRHGSYRALAATANHFARECFIDELAEAAGKDPLAFRLANLDDARLLAVLKAAAEMFDFAGRWKDPKAAIGIACGVEKGSYVANCAEVAIDGQQIAVKRIAMAYECGKILNPSGLMAQVKGAILQGLGPALWEEMTFEDGRITNGRFSQYRVPRFGDVPAIDVNLLDRVDLASAGAGETPIVTVAPAIANAVWRVTGKRSRTMPIRPGT